MRLRRALLGVPGGFGGRGVEGKVRTIHYAQMDEMAGRIVSNG